VITILGVKQKRRHEKIYKSDNKSKEIRAIANCKVGRGITKW
jgi:hypothetical protein